MSLDIQSNRAKRKYSANEMLRRLFWGMGSLLFHFSPRPCFRWRSMVLRCFGATVGRHVHIYPSTRIYFPWNLTIGDWGAIGEDALIYNLGPVTIGEKVTISHRAHVCAGTHDYKDPNLPLLKPAIVIKDQAWICADAFVGPGVTVGEGAVVGARAVVVKDVAPWAVVAGNPARFLKKREMNPEWNESSAR
ncbi:WcaF family extracellular polysaccharide biosynthesis acetyltransferase [Methylacidiphilales bacterium]|nr:WcaF family extracellular polysaccharide biosynthesis acetyltransferase [Candidatus Methylacidiphilales bacterium]